MSQKQPSDLFEALIVPAVVAAVRMQDQREHLRWMQESLLTMQRDGGLSLPPDPQRLRQMACGLARAVWNVTPLPRNGLSPRTRSRRRAATIPARAGPDASTSSAASNWSA